MNTQIPKTTTRADRLALALRSGDASARLQAALTAGTTPEPDFVEPLVARCGVEPDFSVRDMLTWALTRMPRELALPAVLAELNSPAVLARSQALHTLSKFGDPATWPAIRSEFLHDADPDIARTAWRAAVAVAPEAAHADLARELASELGRGDAETMRSLSRALAALGDAAIAPVRDASRDAGPTVRIHALATARLLEDPDASFALDPADAGRMATAFSGSRGAH
ncbi:hypothetical protein BMH32_14570 [Leucobacter sp. OLJS4]|uniref:HEAT repeat domain-containing protein n=1 Tax=unclassified Leucobacter TaxID=2621730 RepID=UPI000C192E21|nr:MULTISPECIES: HEAT repeat domain-containing protein [unclassified Leucobacter]PII87563.1 hypothetical protein BMH25_00475 [Leucobacter sp. OLCALW19]PII93321.1 hypothetical protein BMH27_03790 [Leucobacter sp. OLAS13]PII96421.1 hypothetical protein BMH26_00275 [Leucobacter sp. OLTLW20]PII99047.1 hypothetical protein BMH29_06355 [Leucobacter sp. OLDS2]PIJ01045.1 hypothetical protein BMH28_07815 [Leucobacter sp. OLCS4]